MLVCWLDEVMEREKLMIQEKEGIIDGVISNHNNGKMRGLLLFFYKVWYTVISSEFVKGDIWAKDEGEEKCWQKVVSSVDWRSQLGCIKLKFQKWYKGIMGHHMRVIIFYLKYKLWGQDLYFSHYYIHEKAHSSCSINI